MISTAALSTLWSKWEISAVFAKPGAVGSPRAATPVGALRQRHSEIWGNSIFTLKHQHILE